MVVVVCVCVCVCGVCVWWAGGGVAGGVQWRGAVHVAGGADQAEHEEGDEVRPVRGPDADPEYPAVMVPALDARAATQAVDLARGLRPLTVRAPARLATRRWRQRAGRGARCWVEVLEVEADEEHHNRHDDREQHWPWEGLVLCAVFDLGANQQQLPGQPQQRRRRAAGPARRSGSPPHLCRPEGREVDGVQNGDAPGHRPAAQQPHEPAEHGGCAGWTAHRRRAVATQLARPPTCPPFADVERSVLHLVESAAPPRQPAKP